MASRIRRGIFASPPRSIIDEMGNAPLDFNRSKTRRSQESMIRTKAARGMCNRDEDERRDAEVMERRTEDSNLKTRTVLGREVNAKRRHHG